MRLIELLQGLEYECLQGTLDREVTEVCLDSRKEMQEGALFVCLSGVNFDGHDYAAQVVEKGARVLVIERQVGLIEEMTQAGDMTIIKVSDTRYALAWISAAWFGHPAEKLKVIGITGTKGKTTTAFMVKAILENAGYKVGLMGTIGVVFGEQQYTTSNTTPESYLIQKYFAQMVEAGMDCVVMEVSSQALKQHRTQGFVFDYGIFTNLEHDHVGPGEHADMDEYMQCKGLLFRQCRIGIANGDDIHLEQVMQGHTCHLETFGMGENCDLRGEDLKLVHKPGELGIDFKVSGLMNFRVEVSTPGLFSVYNALTAMAICAHFQIHIADIQKALSEIKVKGRIEKIGRAHV